MTGIRGRAAAALAVCVVFVASPLPRAVPTEAAWADPEWTHGYAGASGAVGTLATVSPATITQCTFNGGLTATVDVYWTLPAGAWTVDNARLYTAPAGGNTLSDSGKVVDNTTTVPSGPGYKSTIALGLLGLGGGLIGTRDTAIVLQAGTWQSAEARIRVRQLAGLVGSCAIQ
ncbi:MULTISPECIES: hypothetical protein [Arthrobacter]|uniref:Uncharacterized protein n=2 Tax=Arthrobacter TaxID=1663 RepID=A0ABU9KIA2_9MICC|nr:hypothetical protein [Arthrobacter sp. YJM1]MDP5226482.1 hypothetical protein [Arthrobacter sp. YJM1]